MEEGTWVLQQLQGQTDMTTHYTITNGQAVPLQAIPSMAWQEFTDWLLAECASGARACALFGVPEPDLPASVRLPATEAHDRTRIFAVLARSGEATLGLASGSTGPSYPSLTPVLPSLHLFERELYEKFGIEPKGHPWLKPVRFPDREGPRAGDSRFFTVSGEEVHEVAVGPIHAGVIECGHFRFQCLGETVMHLEISLGYHHRGIEKALTTGPGKNTLQLMEVVAGDTTVGHS